MFQTHRNPIEKTIYGAETFGGILCMFTHIFTTHLHTVAYDEDLYMVENMLLYMIADMFTKGYYKVIEEILIEIYFDYFNIIPVEIKLQTS